jgi:circadian clock protein KaiC
MDSVITSLTGTPPGAVLDKTATGISGLDQITGGGLPTKRVTLVAGSAGAAARRWADSDHGDGPPDQEE